jgi:hypothetical protein
MATAVDLLTGYISNSGMPLQGGVSTSGGGGSLIPAYDPTPIGQAPQTAGPAPIYNYSNPNNPYASTTPTLTGGVSTTSGGGGLLIGGYNPANGINNYLGQQNYATQPIPVGGGLAQTGATVFNNYGPGQTRTMPDGSVQQLGTNGQWYNLSGPTNTTNPGALTPQQIQQIAANNPNNHAPTPTPTLQGSVSTTDHPQTQNQSQNVTVNTPQQAAPRPQSPAGQIDFASLPNAIVPMGPMPGAAPFNPMAITAQGWHDPLYGLPGSQQQPVMSDQNQTPGHLYGDNPRAYPQQQAQGWRFDPMTGQPITPPAINNPQQASYQAPQTPAYDQYMNGSPGNPGSGGIPGYNSRVADLQGQLQRYDNPAHPQYIPMPAQPTYSGQGGGGPVSKFLTGALNGIGNAANPGMAMYRNRVDLLKQSAHADALAQRQRDRAALQQQLDNLITQHGYVAQSHDEMMQRSKDAAEKRNADSRMTETEWNKIKDDIIKEYPRPNDAQRYAIQRANAMHPGGNWDGVFGYYPKEAAELDQKNQMQQIRQAKYDHEMAMYPFKLQALQASTKIAQNNAARIDTINAQKDYAFQQKSELDNLRGMQIKQNMDFKSKYGTQLAQANIQRAQALIEQNIQNTETKMKNNAKGLTDAYFRMQTSFMMNPAYNSNDPPDENGHPGLTAAQKQEALLEKTFGPKVAGPQSMNKTIADAFSTMREYDNKMKTHLTDGYAARVQAQYAKLQTDPQGLANELGSEDKNPGEPEAPPPAKPTPQAKPQPDNFNKERQMFEEAMKMPLDRAAKMPLGSKPRQAYDAFVARTGIGMSEAKELYSMMASPLTPMIASSATGVTPPQGQWVPKAQIDEQGNLKGKAPDQNTEVPKYLTDVVGKTKPKPGYIFDFNTQSPKWENADQQKYYGNNTNMGQQWVYYVPKAK